MDKDQIINIIESALASGNKTPGMFDLPKIFAIKTELQACHTIDDFLAIIEEHRDLISKAFGLSAEVIDSTVEKIKSIENK
jgi:hypothetical protein